MLLDHALAAGARFLDDVRRRIRDDLARITAAGRRAPARAAAGIAMGALLAAGFTPSAGAADEAGPLTVAARHEGIGFSGSEEPGRPGVEASAVALAAAVGLPVDRDGWAAYLTDLTAASPAACPASRLTVSWVPPGSGYHVGGHVSPIGPAPSGDTQQVNGIVLCTGSRYAYLGFEATYELGRWWLTAVPALAREEPGALLAGEAEAAGPAPANGASGAAGTAALPPSESWSAGDPEPPARHAPQQLCDPIAKAGVLGFRDLLLEAFPGTRNLGIGRACEIPGVSEHKEGRAFDWGVRFDNPVEIAAAQAVIAWLLAPDARGNDFTMARRTGLMYMIWDGHIWSAELAHEGWRPYVGVSNHRDHIHFSFSWPGARAETSFWTGDLRRRLSGNAPDLPLLAPRTVVTVPPALSNLAPTPAPAPASPQQPPAEAPARSASSEPAPSTTTTSPPTTTTTSTTTTTTTAPLAPAPTTPAPEPTVPVIESGVGL